MDEIFALFVFVTLFCCVAEDILLPGRVPWAWRHQAGSCGHRCEACDRNS